MAQGRVFVDCDIRHSARRSGVVGSATRRLAMPSADVAGYSRLMRADEEDPRPSEDAPPHARRSKTRRNTTAASSRRLGRHAGGVSERGRCGALRRRDPTGADRQHCRRKVAPHPPRQPRPQSLYGGGFNANQHVPRARATTSRFLTIFSQQIIDILRDLVRDNVKDL